MTSDGIMIELMKLKARLQTINTITIEANESIQMVSKPPKIF